MTEKFVKHDAPMVEPDFKLDTIHPCDEPFWMIVSPYDPDGPGGFLLDRGGMMELRRQIDQALAQYHEKFPLEPTDVPLEEMRPNGPKEK